MINYYHNNKTIIILLECLDLEEISNCRRQSTYKEVSKAINLQIPRSVITQPMRAKKHMLQVLATV